MPSYFDFVQVVKGFVLSYQEYGTSNQDRVRARDTGKIVKCVVHHYIERKRILIRVDRRDVDSKKVRDIHRQRRHNGCKGRNFADSGY